MAYVVAQSPRSQLASLFMKKRDRSQAPPPPPTDTTNPPFSLLGVRLSYFSAFIKQHGGAKAFAGLTTKDVSTRFVKPFTEAAQMSLCDTLLSSKKPSDRRYVATATWFISHAWKFVFLDVVSALNDFFAKESGDHDPVVWFDLFSNSQHGVVDRPFEWWTGTFMNAVENIGNVVMLLMPWDDPIPLRRAWCVFELFACAKTSSRFEVALSRSEAKRFAETFKTNYRSFRDLLGVLRSEESEASVATDRNKIHQAIRDSIGFPEMDRMMLAVFEQWMVDALKKQIDAALDIESMMSWSSAAGKLFIEEGKPQQALEVLEAALARNSPKNKLSGSMLAVLHDLARAYEFTGRLREAEPIYLQLLEFEREIFGVNHPSALTTAHNLAGLYVKQERYQEAETLRVDIVKRSQSATGDDAHALVFKRGLAILYMKQGRFREAEPLMQDSLDKCRTLFGERHPDTTDSLYHLALIQLSLGNIAKSKETLTESYELLSRRHGKHHAQTITACNNLGILHIQLGYYAKAKEYCEEYLAINLAIFGPSNRDTLLGQANVGVVNYLLGHYEEADIHLTASVRNYAKFYGLDQPANIVTLINLGILRKLQKRMDEAEYTFDQALLFCERRGFNESHETHLRATEAKGSNYILQQKYTEAEILLSNCIRLRKAKSAGISFEILRCQRFLAEALYHLDRFDEAEELIVSCCDQIHNNYNVNHPVKLQMKFILAGVREKQGRRADSLELYQSSVAGLATVLGDAHPEVLEFRLQLAEKLQ
ncbi:Kinesin light chain 3 [Entophlyctis luteolus]|nr:Kinesin light chain 3 [Entophlyctis luteolus]